MKMWHVPGLLVVAFIDNQTWTVGCLNLLKEITSKLH